MQPQKLWYIMYCFVDLCLYFKPNWDTTVVDYESHVNLVSFISEIVTLCDGKILLQILIQQVWLKGFFF